MVVGAALLAVITIVFSNIRRSSTVACILLIHTLIPLSCLHTELDSIISDNMMSGMEQLPQSTSATSTSVAQVTV